MPIRLTNKPTREVAGFGESGSAPFQTHETPARALHSGGFDFRVLERESLGRAAYTSLAAEAQLIDGTCVKLVVLLEHPLNCLGL